MKEQKTKNSKKPKTICHHCNPGGSPELNSNFESVKPSYIQDGYTRCDIVINENDVKKPYREDDKKVVKNELIANLANIKEDIVASHSELELDKHEMKKAVTINDMLLACLSPYDKTDKSIAIVDKNYDPVSTMLNKFDDKEMMIFQAKKTFENVLTSLSAEMPKEELESFYKNIDKFLSPTKLTSKYFERVTQAMENLSKCEKEHSGYLDAVGAHRSAYLQAKGRISEVHMKYSYDKSVEQYMASEERYVEATKNYIHAYSEYKLSKFLNPEPNVALDQLVASKHGDFDTNYHTETKVKKEQIYKNWANGNGMFRRS